MASMHGKAGKRKKTKRIGKAEVLTRDQYELFVLALFDSPAVTLFVFSSIFFHGFGSI